jgi:hypothetical protein
LIYQLVNEMSGMSVCDRFRFAIDPMTEFAGNYRLSP